MWCKMLQPGKEFAHNDLITPSPKYQQNLILKPKAEIGLVYEKILKEVSTL